MVGGLAYELLTGGTPPFHWLATDLLSALLLGRRRGTAYHSVVELPGSRFSGLRGLLGKSVLEVAKYDGEPIPWCVRAEGTPGGPGRLAELKALLEQCLAAEPEARPKLPALLAAFRDLLVREEGEERAAGIGGGGAGGRGLSTPATVLAFPLPASTASHTSAAAGQVRPAGVCDGFMSVCCEDLLLLLLLYACFMMKGACLWSLRPLAQLLKAPRWTSCPCWMPL
jgi:hypothetical protein